MKKLWLLLILLFIIGCAPKISTHFEQNKYIKNFSTHVLNDSLQLYFKTPADITYITDRRELKKTIKKTTFKIHNTVLLYGKTDDPPYEFFVTLSEKGKQNYSNNLVSLDTIIGNQTIQFIGNPLIEKSKKTLETDLNTIFKSVEVGPNYRKDISTVMEVVQKYQNSNRYLAALTEINEFPTYDKQEEWAKFQMQLTFSSFLGNNAYYTTYLDKLESRFKSNDTISKLVKNNVLTGSKVIETIVKEAEKHRVVMINENHFFPNHRLLVTELLSNLKDIGYTHLALESLGVQQDSILNKDDAYPTLETGFYTAEQHYSNLIRKAKDLGYTFVAYENLDSNTNREIGQADNLYNKTFKEDSKCKVLVLAGIDHILEKPNQSGKKWMATVFKEKYGIDPLTISQTHLNAYRKEINTEYAIIEGNLFKNDRYNSVDYLVLNNLKKKSLDDSLTFQYQNKAKVEVQVALFYETELERKFDYNKKVPYFSIILKSNEKYNLPIDKNTVTHLFTFDKSGKQIDKQIINE